MEKQRLDYLDLAKGIAIFFVVFGHTGENLASKFVYSFHMPLFFFLSGISLSLSRIENYKFVGRKIINLLVPFLILGSSGLVYGKQQMFSAYWYLPVLFSFSLVIFFNKIFKNIILKIFINLILLAFCVVLLKSGYQFCNSLSFYCLAFFCPFLLGYFYLDYKDKAPEWLFSILLVAVVITLPLYLDYQAERHSILFHVYKNIIGIGITFCILKVLQNVKIENNTFLKNITNIGKSTMAIYMFHFFLIGSFYYNGGLLDSVVNSVLTIVIILLCLIIEKFILLSPFLSCIFLGKLPKKYINMFY